MVLEEVEAAAVVMIGMQVKHIKILLWISLNSIDSLCNLSSKKDKALLPLNSRYHNNQPQQQQLQTILTKINRLAKLLLS